MNVFRRTACTRICAADTGRRAGVPAAGGLRRADRGNAGARSRSRGSIRSSRTSCSRWTTRAAWGGITFPTTSRTSAPGIAHCRDGLQCGGAAAATRHRIPRSASTILPSAAAATTASSTILPPSTGPARRRTAPTFPARAPDTTCGAPWTAVYNNGFAGYPGANSGTTIDLTTGYPDTVWCWKSAPTALEKQTADGNGSVCRSNGRSLQRRDGRREHDARDRRRLQLSEQLRRLLGRWRSASSSTDSRSTAIPTTTGSRRSSSARTRTPRAGARLPAPANGTRRPTSMSGTARARRRSIRRPSRASTSSRPASSSTAPPRQIPAASRMRRR